VHATDERPNPRFVITGTSGTGKTTLLNCLRQHGFKVYEEAARQVLQEQLEVDGPALPAKNPLLFVERMLQRCEHDHRQAAGNGVAFFDRGIPDLIAYAKRFAVPGESFEHAAAQLRYSPTVFLLTPWRDIFVADELRRQSFEQYNAFHELIVESYTRAGYDLLVVPQVDVEARTRFIIETVAQANVRGTSVAANSTAR
jgi:predicted ATPase